jgi:hypothetical protein
MPLFTPTADIWLATKNSDQLTNGSTYNGGTGSVSGAIEACVERENMFKDMGYFDVRNNDYGATGDGTTDDASAASAAVAAAIAAGGGTVLFRRQTTNNLFLFDSQVNVDTSLVPLRILLEPGVTLRKGNSNNARLFDFGPLSPTIPSTTDPAINFLSITGGGRFEGRTDKAPFDGENVGASGGAVNNDNLMAFKQCGMVYVNDIDFNFIGNTALRPTLVGEDNNYNDYADPVTYVSATEVNVGATDLTARYPVGAIIRLVYENTGDSIGGSFDLWRTGRVLTSTFTGSTTNITISVTASNGAPTTYDYIQLSRVNNGPFRGLFVGNNLRFTDVAQMISTNDSGSYGTVINGMSADRCGQIKVTSKFAGAGFMRINDASFNNCGLGLWIQSQSNFVGNGLRFTNMSQGTNSLGEAILIAPNTEMQGPPDKYNKVVLNDVTSDNGGNIYITGNSTVISRNIAINGFTGRNMTTGRGTGIIFVAGGKFEGVTLRDIDIDASNTWAQPSIWINPDCDTGDTHREDIAIINPKINRPLQDISLKRNSGSRLVDGVSIMGGSIHCKTIDARNVTNFSVSPGTYLNTASGWTLTSGGNNWRVIGATLETASSSDAMNLQSGNSLVLGCKFIAPAGEGLVVQNCSNVYVGFCEADTSSTCFRAGNAGTETNIQFHYLFGDSSAGSGITINSTGFRGSNLKITAALRAFDSNNNNSGMVLRDLNLTGNTDDIRIGSGETNWVLDGYNVYGNNDANINETGRLAGLESVNIKAIINAQTGTTYTLLKSDNGKTVTLNNASAITLTVPSGLGVGFNCHLVQLGAGQVTITTSGTTVNNRQSHTKIAGQNGKVSLTSYVANTFVLDGDTAA